jgi:hypothetical protein
LLSACQSQPLANANKPRKKYEANKDEKEERVRHLDSVDALLSKSFCAVHMPNVAGKGASGIIRALSRSAQEAIDGGARFEGLGSP